MNLITATPDAAACNPAMEEALNLYADGELDAAAQPALFAHLAGCVTCRHTLAALLEFRRVSRQELMLVPAAADDAFFQRLDDLKRRTDRVDRVAERRPLWQRRPRISLSLAACLALLLLGLGTLVPRSTDTVVQPRIEVLEERIEFAPLVPVRGEAVYVFYPGLTVEATKLDGAL